MPTAPVTSGLIGEALKQIGAQLQQRLAETRVSLRHGGDKGAHAESALRQTLARYLPRRLVICQGEVIDTTGKRSAQVDIVVCNEDQPLIYPENEPGLFFIEGVDAAGEVKSVLTGEELERAIQGSIKFKALTARDAIGLRVASASDVDRFHDHRPFFIVAYESQLSLETIAERVGAASEAAEQDGKQIVDGIFVLDRGTVLNLGSGYGSLGIEKPDGTRHTGWIIHPSDDDAMYGLIAWLSMVMPRVQRLTPILPEYMIAVGRQPSV